MLNPIAGFIPPVGALSQEERIENVNSVFKVMHGFYQCPIEGGRIVGEDVYFCNKWREMGGKVYLDPRHWTTHNDGVRAYGGCVGTWLNKGLETAMAAE